jgi:hypothetical protein
VEPVATSFPSVRSDGVQIAETETEPSSDVYTLVIDALLALLNEPQSNEWLADKMCVRVAQMNDWLDRSLREGRIRKLKKPVRYAAHTPSLFAE